jgi:hypothetical protein
MLRENRLSLAADLMFWPPLESSAFPGAQFQQLKHLISTGENLH